MSAPDEAGSVAREMAAAYRDYVRFATEQLGKAPEEAAAAAAEPASDHIVAFAAAEPPEQLSWHEIDALAHRDPALAGRIWERIKREAREELASGHRAALPLEGHRHRPWERARYLALREALAAEWGARDGIERLLTEMVAQAYTGYEMWLERFVACTTMEAEEQELDHLRERGKWRPPRAGVAETIERAAANMERYHRMLIRAQRALRDQRRYSVKVGSVGQLNIGMVQRNVAGEGRGGERGEGEGGGRIIEGEAR